MVNTLLKEIAENEKRIKELEAHNTKLQQACHKWFMRWRREKKEVIRVSNMAGFKCNQELNKNLSEVETEFDKMFWQKNEIIQKEKETVNKAKEIISEWLRLHNSNTKKTIIKKSENFLKEEA